MPLAEAGLAGNPWLLSNQIDLFFSHCHHLKGTVLLLGLSSSNSAQIFECPKAADRNDFNSGILVPSKVFLIVQVTIPGPEVFFGGGEKDLE